MKIPIRRISSILLAVSIYFVPGNSNAEARSKVDVVILENGDRITGEIKSLNRGLLSVSTDFMGTVSIEWEHVREVQSPQDFEVEVQNGTRYYGSLESNSEEKVIRVLSNEGEPALRQMDVVNLEQLEENRLGRIDASVDLGYSFARANRVTQLNLNSDFRNRSRRYEQNVRYSSSFNAQKEVEGKSRNDLSGTFARKLPDRWIIEGVAQLQQNEELGLQRRTLLGGGVGRWLVQNNRYEILLLGGTVWTREKFAETESQNSAEGIGALQLHAFRYDTPKMEVNLSATALPSLTDPGRIRIEFNTSFRFELYKDLFWSLNGFDSFDSKPPETSGRLEKNDFGVSTSVGYRF